MMPRLPPLFAMALLLAAGNGQCCSNGAVATAQAAEVRHTHTEKATAADEAAAPQMNIDGLIARLKQTSAIGMLTKLVLRSNVNDLIDEVKRYKRSRETPTQLEKIRAHFNGLLLKVLALLDEDPKLAEDIQCARDSLWHHLMEVKA